jgi:hypothetical protein
MGGSNFEGRSFDDGLSCTRWGGDERNPAVERLRAVLQELDIRIEDDEHASVLLQALAHVYEANQMPAVIPRRSPDRILTSMIG